MQHNLCEKREYDFFRQNVLLKEKSILEPGLKIDALLSEKLIRRIRNITKVGFVASSLVYQNPVDTVTNVTRILMFTHLLYQRTHSRVFLAKVSI